MADETVHILLGAEDRTGAGIDSASARLKKMEDGAKTLGVAFAAMGATVGAAFTASIVASARFGTAFNEVRTITDESLVSTRAMREGLLTMGESFQSAQADANALYQAISAGVEAGEALKFVGEASKLAVAGVSSTTAAVDALTSIMNAYGLEATAATEISDSLFTAVRLGKTTLDELNASIGPILPHAAALGVNFDTVGAALVAMTKQGIKTTEAATFLKNALQALKKPSAEAAATAEQLGIQLGTAAVKEKGFAAVLDEVRIKTAGNDAALQSLFGSIRAGTAVLALTGQGAQDFTDALDGMTQKAGAVNKAYSIMSKDLGMQFKGLQADMDRLLIKLGDELEAEARRAVIAARELIATWDELTELQKGLIMQTGKTVLAIGAVSVALLAAAKAVPALLGALAAIKLASAATAVSFAELTVSTGGLFALFTVGVAATWAIYSAVNGLTTAAAANSEAQDGMAAATRDADNAFIRARASARDLALELKTGTMNYYQLQAAMMVTNALRQRDIELTDGQINVLRTYVNKLGEEDANHASLTLRLRDYIKMLEEGHDQQGKATAATDGLAGAANRARIVLTDLGVEGKEAMEGLMDAALRADPAYQAAAAAVAEYWVTSGRALSRTRIGMETALNEMVARSRGFATTTQDVAQMIADGQSRIREEVKTTTVVAGGDLLGLTSIVTGVGSIYRTVMADMALASLVTTGDVGQALQDLGAAWQQVVGQISETLTAQATERSVQLDSNLERERIFYEELGDLTEEEQAAWLESMREHGLQDTLEWGLMLTGRRERLIEWQAWLAENNLEGTAAWAAVNQQLADIDRESYRERLQAQKQHAKDSQTEAKNLGTWLTNNQQQVQSSIAGAMRAGFASMSGEAHTFGNFLKGFWKGLSQAILSAITDWVAGQITKFLISVFAAKGAALSKASAYAGEAYMGSYAFWSSFGPYGMIAAAAQNAIILGQYGASMAMIGAESGGRLEGPIGAGDIVPVAARPSEALLPPELADALVSVLTTPVGGGVGSAVPAMAEGLPEEAATGTGATVVIENLMLLDIEDAGRIIEKINEATEYGGYRLVATSLVAEPE